MVGRGEGGVGVSGFENRFRTMLILQEKGNTRKSQLRVMLNMVAENSQAMKISFCQPGSYGFHLYYLHIVILSH